MWDLWLSCNETTAWTSCAFTMYNLLAIGFLDCVVFCNMFILDCQAVCSFKFDPVSRSVRGLPYSLGPWIWQVQNSLWPVSSSAAGTVWHCLPFISFGWFYRVGLVAPFRTPFFPQCWDWQNVFKLDIRSEVYWLFWTFTFVFHNSGSYY